MPAISLTMADLPVEPSEAWGGYFHKKDPTYLPRNVLTYPSQNCFIPDTDKILPREGSKAIGKTYTLVFSIIGGFFQQGETILQTVPSVARGIVSSVNGSVMIVVDPLATFTVGSLITGQTSGATASIVSYTANLVNSGMKGHAEKYSNPAGDELEVRSYDSLNGNLLDILEIYYQNPLTLVTQWWRITENINPIPRGAHRYYFDTWYDTSVGGVSLNIPRLIWVNGLDKIMSWTGAIAPILSLTATTLTVSPGLTWEGLGFIDPANGGSGKIVVNGVEYTGSTGWATDTLDVGSTTGIQVNDLAFDKILVNNAPKVFDVCGQVKNYMEYGSWNSRSLYMSNNFNHIATQEITNVQATQNDMILSGTYNSTGSHIVRYQIDSIISDPVSAFYAPTSAALDNAYFSGTRAPTITTRDTYRVVISSVSPNQYDVYKNNVLVISGDPITPDVATFVLDDIFITFVDIGATAYVLGTSWTYTIGGQDTYSWYLDGAIQASGIGVSIPLNYNGITMQPNAVYGHSLGDYWEVTVNQAITQAWANFYYTLPERKPGEGYIFNTLPSNFWAMGVQEDNMYINTAYGEWVYFQSDLSSDLTSEKISIEPLKKTTRNKVLFPYMISHMNNYLVYVNDDKALDFIGRKELIELPQVGNISDPVKLDFLAASFEDGSMEYWDKKLWITSPHESIMFCYDDIMKYWQPPQVFPENGMLSTIGQDLVSHSFLRNQTNKLFTGTNDNGDNYTIRMRTGYLSWGERWKNKNANMTFVEGMILGAPKINYKVILDVGGCHGIPTHEISPIVCVLPDTAPLGEGSFGSHGLGNDLLIGASYFQEIYKSKMMEFTFAAIELESTSKDPTFAIFSLGLNTTWGNKNNSKAVSNKIVVP